MLHNDNNNMPIIYIMYSNIIIVYNIYIYIYIVHVPGNCGGSVVLTPKANGVSDWAQLEV